MKLLILLPRRRFYSSIFRLTYKVNFVLAGTQNFCFFLIEETQIDDLTHFVIQYCSFSMFVINMKEEISGLSIYVMNLLLLKSTLGCPQVG